jgi:ABC-type transport system substrate-binding protein
VRALLGIATCHDPNLFSDELTAPPAPNYDPTFALPAYNPAGAAALLDHAGYPVVDNIRRAKDGKTPLQLRLLLSGHGEEAIGIARSMQADYARNLHIGVTIVVERFAFASYDQGGQAATGGFDILLYAGASSPDPVGQFMGYDTADIPSAQNPSGGNYFGIVDPHLGEQDQLGSEAIDGQERAGVYRALQRYFAQQFYILPVYILADVSLTKATLCNFKKWPGVLSATWNMADWYVASSCP